MWSHTARQLTVTTSRLAAGGARACAGVTRAMPRILRSEVQDIIFHFAVEEYLMQNARLTGPLMYLWRPAPVVTIGRHQNPWKECILSRLEEDGVALVRRRTGGGTVFQDLGCSVFTFIAPSSHFNIDRNLDMVLGALRRCGIQAEKKGRNDLTFEGRKISGSAFKHSPDRSVSLHHGTVLVNTDLKALQRYLTPNKLKLQAKGIASVGARVMNLRERFESFEHNALCSALVDEFREVEGGPEVPVEVVDEASPLVAESAFRGYRAELEDRAWRLGRTPEFSHQMETRVDGVGVFDVQLQVVGGVIEHAVIFSDALYPDVIDKAMEVLAGVQYGRESIRAALEGLQQHWPDQGPRLLVDALVEWLPANVDD